MVYLSQSRRGKGVFRRRVSEHHLLDYVKLSLCSHQASAGIGFGPDGLRAMEFIEEGFQATYEDVCVSNKHVKDQHVFFEVMLMRRGLGIRPLCLDQDAASLTTDPGKDKPWYGKSSWGASRYIRKSVGTSIQPTTGSHAADMIMKAHRKALLDIMTSFIPIENVQFNKRLTDVEQYEDKVVLTFLDGGTGEASV